MKKKHELQITNSMESPREIGNILKKARQGKGLTLEKIWNATRIQGKIIEALEGGTADDILAKVYVLLFLKKYAAFLDLDAANLVGNYKAFYNTPEEQVLNIQKEPPPINIEIKKWILPAVVFFLVIISAFFIMFLGAKLKAFYRARKEASIVLPAVTKPPTETGIGEKAKGIFPIPKNKSIYLVLQSDDDVWIKVWENGKVSFEGTLGKNKEKRVSSDNNIKLWVGRAEALDFKINDAFIGKIGKGNIKDIEISRNGLKVGKKWFIQAKK